MLLPRQSETQFRLLADTIMFPKDGCDRWLNYLLYLKQTRQKQLRDGSVTEEELVEQVNDIFISDQLDISTVLVPAGVYLWQHYNFGAWAGTGKPYTISNEEYVYRGTDATEGFQVMHVPKEVRDSHQKLLVATTQSSGLPGDVTKVIFEGKKSIACQ